MAVALWQSAEQRCREVEAADAAAVARLVRGVLCCRDPRNAPLLCVCPDHVCVGVVVMVEPGGCGSWRAAKSRGAQCSCLAVLLVGGISGGAVAEYGILRDLWSSHLSRVMTCVQCLGLVVAGFGSLCRLLPFVFDRLAFATTASLESLLLHTTRRLSRSQCYCW